MRRWSPGMVASLAIVILMVALGVVAVTEPPELIIGDVRLSIVSGDVRIHNTQYMAGSITLRVSGDLPPGVAEPEYPKASGFQFIIYHTRIDLGPELSQGMPARVLWIYIIPVYLIEILLGCILLVLIWRDRHIYASWRKTRRLGFPVAAITSPADSKSVTSHEGL